MMERVKLILVSLVISLFFTGQASAITIADVYTGDLNKITKKEYPSSKKLVVYEDYGENYLVSYPSHDGYAIVNEDGNFFDKVVNLTVDDCCCGSGGCCSGSGGCSGSVGCTCSCDPETWTFEFYVHNTSPYAWSDYHFEFWDEDFTERYNNFPLLSGSSNIFQNSKFEASVLEFWAPDWQDLDVTNHFSLTINLSQFERECCCTHKNDKCCFCDGQNVELFGIRQVATTVPEPATMLLLGTGLIGLGWVGRRKV